MGYQVMYLLDTNALLWWLSDDKRLGKKSREIIADISKTTYISAFSIFEASIKHNNGKLKINFDELDEEINNARFKEISFNTRTARQFVTQKAMPQSDPFDAGIVAQAISRNLVLITSDRNILDLQIDGLRMVDARE